MNTVQNPIASNEGDVSNEEGGKQAERLGKILELKDRPLFICSRQRSGTNALSNILSLNGVKTYFEPFLMIWHMDYSFDRFLEKNCVSAKFFVYNPTNVLLDYLDWLFELAGGQRFSVDVKFNQMHLFDGFSYVQGNRPGLLRVIQKQKFPIIHLIRRNAFAQFLSRQMQFITKVHHLEKGVEQPSPEPFNLDIEKCKAHIATAELESSRFKAWNEGYGMYMQLIYEECFQNNQLTRGSGDKLKNRFGVNIEEFGSEYVKFYYDFNELILNKGAVIRAFSKTKYAGDVEKTFTPKSA